MSKDNIQLEVTESSLPQVVTPAQLLSQAIAKGMGVAELEKLVALQERWEANQARKAFFQAFTGWQTEAPDIRKTKQVAFDTKTGGKTDYHYAPLADICRQIGPVLKKHDLSYRWEIQDSATEIKVTCLVSHVDGHTERTTMQANPDTSGSKNAIQARGSAIEYMKRYTLIGALGLATADSDIDGRTHEYDYNVDELHKKYMDVYNQVIQLEPRKYAPLHPDNWLIERTGKNYVKAIGDIRKILFDLQQKEKKQ